MASTEKRAQCPFDFYALPVQRAAFFDLDKTILATSSSLAFSKPLYEQGLIKRADVVRNAYRQFIFTIAGASHEQTERMREHLSALVTGWDVKELEVLIKDSLDGSITPLVHAEVVDLIKQHKANGDKVVIVSASGNEIVKPVSAMIEADDFIATELEIFHGKYTGAITFYAYGENKAIAIQKYAKEHNIDLAKSFAYSDSITDLPMLEVVGHPIVVNPDAALNEVAAERSWPVIRCEKPVALKKPLLDYPEQRKKAFITAAAVFTFFAWMLSRRKKQKRDSV
ncbi:MAG: hypothetical protein RIS09_1060 [Actinomycetota bacterium]